jgi:hypothetical protein
MTSSNSTIRVDNLRLNRLVAAIHVSYRRRLGIHRQPLGGTIAPGEYYLIALASAARLGLPLPAANIVGDINMSGTTGKVALVSNFDALEGTCPLGDSDIVDLSAMARLQTVLKRRTLRRRATHRDLPEEQRRH